MIESQRCTDRELADVLPDAIIVLDERGKILWWNITADNFFALTENKYEDITELLKQRAFRAYLINKGEKPVEIMLGDANKTVISVAIVSYGKEQQLFIARDITHISRLEIMREDFVANVSHELRTPLTVIHGYLEMLTEKYSEQTGPFKRIFSQMYQQSVRMEKLVKDLLLLSRLEITEPHKDDLPFVVMAPLLQAISDDAAALSGKSEHGFHLNIDDKLNLLGNEDELQSAFSNLIFNAVKYTPAGGDIYVDWHADENGACLQVHDTGIGIAEEHIPRLTERFYRVDKARSRVSGGTGLGLAIVKHVLKRHEGNLTISSELGSGSTFACCFPLERISKSC